MNFAASPDVAEHNANLLLAALPPQELAQVLPALDQVQVEAARCWARRAIRSATSIFRTIA
jgi:hypothetical protein